MGPDEHITRKEMDLVIEFLLSQIRQQGEIIAKLGGLLVSSGAIKDADLLTVTKDLEKSPRTRRALDTAKSLEEFWTVQDIARRYLGTDLGTAE